MMDERAPDQTSETSETETKAARGPRTAGPLDLPRNVALPFIRLQLRERFPKDRKYVVPPTATLSLEAVQTLEEFLRVRLPDEVLAFFATPARALSEFQLSKVGGLTEAAWDNGLFKGRVVLGVVGNRFLCISKRSDPGHPVRVSFFDPETRKETEEGTLAAWLDRLEQRADTEVDFDALDRLDNRAAKMEWMPVLVSTQTAPVEDTGVGRRVRHSRFGEGKVLRTFPEGDKLEVDFGDVGVKVLLSKFVEEIEPS